MKPITFLSAPEEQHLLFLFLPIKTNPKPEAATAMHTLFASQSAVGADPRTATGVHFYGIYTLKAGTKPAAPPPFTAFQVPPPNPETGAPRDLVVVFSIYDNDFGPYISAFTDNENFAKVLDLGLLANLDETGFVDPSDPTSAKNILAKGGTFANPKALLSLLMRYNWADPTIPAATTIGKIKNPNPNWKYFLGATFPGLTTTRLLKPSGGYPNINELWPFPGGVIDYASSAPPPGAAAGDEKD